MKVLNADNGAIAEIIVVFLLCAVDQLVVYFPCGLEMPPEEAHHFRRPDFAGILGSLEFFASEITVLEERPVLGPKAAEEAEPTDLDLGPDRRAILRGIVVGINRFAMGDGVDDVDKKTLEGEWGISVSQWERSD
jgi:hypothetical protein